MNNEKNIPSGYLVNSFKEQYFPQQSIPYIQNAYDTDASIISDLILASDDRIMSLLEKLGSFTSSEKFDSYINRLEDNDKFLVYFSFLCLLYVDGFNQIPIPVIPTERLYSELFKCIQSAYSSCRNQCLSDQIDMWDEITSREYDAYCS